MMDFRTSIDQLLADELSGGEPGHVEELPPRQARFAKLRAELHPRLRDRLNALGLDRFYTHQAQAVDAALEGNDVVVVTGTNSGKTLCYNVPAMQHMLSEPACRALYVFPTKALAHDQLGKLEEIAPGPDVRCATYDGDTPPSRRASIRKAAHIVLTNPDMLHVGILPGHESWSKFLKSLRLIVVDEMHVYRGVFGSHVGGILRRLLRLCEWYKSHPQVIACSATIGNPAEVFRKLTGRTPVVVDDDGSPHGRRTFVFWNPPLQEDQTRVSANVVTASLLGGLAECGVRTLAFCRARISTELVLKYARRHAAAGKIVDPMKIEGYRAGYTPAERRQIEQALFKGELLGLAATSAMELGVDVGGLDAVILNGYPGTSASFWQQAGRAGRGTRDSLAVFVAHDDPLEQFLVREPHRLLESKGESVALNPLNPQVLADQLRCAAYERPLAPSELADVGETALAVAEELDRSGVLQFQAGYFFYPSHEAPAPKVNIRGSGSDDIRLMVGDTELGSMERWRALQSAHEGAVYLHRDASYVVEALDLESGVARLVRKDVTYYTDPILQSVIETAVDVREHKWGRGRLVFGGLTVTNLVLGAKMKSVEGGAVIGQIDLDLPPITFATVGLRLELPAFTNEKQAAGLHGAEHALTAVAPLIVGCDRGDLGSAWYPVFPETLEPALFVYDSTPGGVGFAEELFEQRKAWTSAALQLQKSCKCVEGCPGCLLSARCESGNELLDKAGAIALLEELASL
jgi:DEAD/DEAH box helicase domain-containing protein